MKDLKLTRYYPLTKSAICTVYYGAKAVGWFRPRIECTAVSEHKIFVDHDTTLQPITAIQKNFDVSTVSVPDFTPEQHRLARMIAVWHSVTKYGVPFGLLIVLLGIIVVISLPDIQDNIFTTVDISQGVTHTVLSRRTNLFLQTLFCTAFAAGFFAVFAWAFSFVIANLRPSISYRNGRLSFTSNLPALPQMYDYSFWSLQRKIAAILGDSFSFVLYDTTLDPEKATAKYIAEMVKAQESGKPYICFAVQGMAVNSEVRFLLGGEILEVETNAPEFGELGTIRIAPLDESVTEYEYHITRFAQNCMMHLNKIRPRDIRSQLAPPAQKTVPLQVVNTFLFLLIPFLGFAQNCVEQQGTRLHEITAAYPARVLVQKPSGVQVVFNFERSEVDVPATDGTKSVVQLIGNACAESGKVVSIKIGNAVNMPFANYAKGSKIKQDSTVKKSTPVVTESDVSTWVANAQNFMVNGTPERTQDFEEVRKTTAAVCFFIFHKYGFFKIFWAVCFGLTVPYFCLIIAFAFVAAYAKNEINRHSRIKNIFDYAHAGLSGTVGILSMVGLFVLLIFAFGNYVLPVAIENGTGFWSWVAVVCFLVFCYVAQWAMNYINPNTPRKSGQSDFNNRNNNNGNRNNNNYQND